MYFSVWIILVAFSLWFSLMAFFWGLQSGQFSDQERARFLPLRDTCRLGRRQDPAKLPVEVYVPDVHRADGYSGAGRVGNFQFLPILL